MLLKRELKASVAWHRMQTQRLSLVPHIYYLGSCKIQENELISDNDYTVFFNCTHMQGISLSDVITRDFFTLLLSNNSAANIAHLPPTGDLWVVHLHNYTNKYEYCTLYFNSK